MDPQKEILVVSASKVRADDFTTFTLRLISEVPVLQHLRPRDGQWTAGEVVGTDPNSDLAVIALPGSAPDVEALSFAEEPAVVGQEVVLDGRDGR